MMMNTLQIWQSLWINQGSMRRMKALTVAALVATMLIEHQPAAAQRGATRPDGPATFTSSIDLVRVSAFVRDRKGRFVHGLTEGDFEVFENNHLRAITEFRQEQATLSIALLFDVSGSMEAHMPAAREAATHVLSWLKADDEAAVFTFDTQLDEVRGFSSGLTDLPPRLSAVRPFGATSLHDAIARTADRVSTRESLRRAVVVFTDGQDTASRLSASEVSGLARASLMRKYRDGKLGTLRSCETSVRSFSSPSQVSSEQTRQIVERSAFKPTGLAMN